MTFFIKYNILTICLSNTLDLLDATVLQIISAGEVEETVQCELMKNKLKENKQQAITINFNLFQFSS